jgi:hypothetical protein
MSVHSIASPRAVDPVREAKVHLAAAHRLAVLDELEEGIERLEVQVTFYDEFAFLQPVHAVYAFRHATALEDAGYRVTHWECEGTNNAIMDADGSTTYRLPGEAGFVDPRGFTLFPELPGQSFDPVYNVTLDVD